MPRVVMGSVLLHLLLLLGVFVVYRGSCDCHITISSTMINSDAEIIFMPLHKFVSPKTEKSKVTRPASTRSPKSEKLQDVKATTLVKLAVAKKTKPKKETTKKVDTKKIKEEKCFDSAQHERISEIPPADPPPLPSTDVPDSAQADQKNVMYVGQEQMDALQAQEYIQQELAQHWSPPAGMRADLSAVVMLIIDTEGTIANINLAVASGNLLFDTAAKKAAAQITPARWMYGKEIAITFKP